MFILHQLYGGLRRILPQALTADTVISVLQVNKARLREVE